MLALRRSRPPHCGRRRGGRAERVGGSLPSSFVHAERGLRSETRRLYPRGASRSNRLSRRASFYQRFLGTSHPSLFTTVKYLESIPFLSTDLRSDAAPQGWAQGRDETSPCSCVRVEPIWINLLGKVDSLTSAARTDQQFYRTRHQISFKA